tara:strand:- start:325 stop:603 length:279 start_codon:yes stop_codon:yes gene_type:complete
MDYLAKREQLKVLIDSLAVDRKLAVYQWARDCDQCEGDRMDLIPATIVAYESWENNIQDYAEGPCVTRPVNMDDYSDFEASFRDHRAEQYNY